MDRLFVVVLCTEIQSCRHHIQIFVRSEINQLTGYSGSLLGAPYKFISMDTN